MTERTPCPVCSWTQMCNCDVHAESTRTCVLCCVAPCRCGQLAKLAAEEFAGFVPVDLGQLPDGVSCERCDCVHEPPACGPKLPETPTPMYELWKASVDDLQHVEDTKFIAALEGMGVEKAPTGHWEMWDGAQSDSLREALDRLERQYLARPAEKQIVRVAPEPGYAWPEPSAETLAEFAKLIPNGPAPGKYNFPIKTSIEDGRLPPPLSDRAFILDEFREVGSRTWWPGKEEGAPAPDMFFTEAQNPGEQIRCYSDQKPLNELFYCSFMITGLTDEMPKAHAAAFVRHLGESEEQVAMLLAQMSAPLGSCTCQRINGFLFACLACSKAGRS